MGREVDNTRMGKPGTRWGPKRDARERRILLSYVEDLMVKYVRTGPVVDALAEPPYCLRRQDAHRYIRAVRRRWDRESRWDPQDRRDELRARIEGLYAKAMSRTKPIVHEGKVVDEREDPDVTTALRAIKQLADLDGIKAPEQHEHSLSVNVRLEAKSNAELIAELVRLEGPESVPVEVRQLVEGGEDE